MPTTTTNPADTTRPGLWRRSLGLFARVFWLLLALLLLVYVSSLVDQVSCWGVFIILALVAWPIWQYRTEYRLFRRQLVLEGAMQSASFVRTALWKGSVMRVVQVFVSLLLAGLLLLLLSRLSREHWLLLAADGVFVALLTGPVTQWFSASVKAQHIGVIARRWPLFVINGLVLTVAFVLLDFYQVAVADTRSLYWGALAETAFYSAFNSSHCILWGFGSGIVATLEALAWHASQLVIPRLPDYSMKLLAWGVFLLRAATIAWLFTAVLLGVSRVHERRQSALSSGRPWNTFSRAFIGTIIIMALPFIYATVQMNRMVAELDTADVQIADQHVEPCQPGSVQRLQLDSQLDGDIEATRAEAVGLLEQQASEGVALLFVDVEQGVDRYLDWYFTVLGEYERLAAVFTADVAEAMREQLYTYLFADTAFDERLVALDEEMAAVAGSQFIELAPRLAVLIAGSGCTVDDVSLMPLSSLDHDALRASLAAGSGVAAGLVTGKMLAGKTTSAVVAGVAAKKSFQTGAALASKTLAKKGTSTLLSASAGTALCAPTGPVALLCGVTAGLVTWFSVDKALIELDESLNRDEMRADILVVLNEQQVLLADQMTAAHVERVNRMAARLNEMAEQSFVPANEGMGK